MRAGPAAAGNRITLLTLPNLGWYTLDNMPGESFFRNVNPLTFRKETETAADNSGPDEGE